MAMVLTVAQIGGHSDENICHSNSWSSQMFVKHTRFLAGLDDKDNPMDFSGDGIPRISTELWSDAMGDIEINNPIYRPKPAS